MKYREALEFWKKEENINDYKIIENRLLSKIKKLENLLLGEHSKWLEIWLNEQSSINMFPESDFQSHAEGTYVLSTEKPVYFIGDIHSDDESLEQIIKTIDPYNNDVKIVFLGDYVDRGMNHFATLDKLWSLKIDIPDKIFLLRGNHDSGYLENGEVKLEYRQDSKSKESDFFPLYLDHLRTDGKITTKLMEQYFSFSKSLPHIAYIKRDKNWTMAVHGGIPRPVGDNNFYDYIPTLANLNDHSIVDHIDRSVVKNMLWSDPKEGLTGEVIDKGRFSTYEQHFNAFSKRHGINMLVRGHVAEKEGHKPIYQHRVHTIFSSGGSSKTTAYAYVKTPKIMKLFNDSNYEIVDIW